jgi:hypothetical protein
VLGVLRGAPQTLEINDTKSGFIEPAADGTVKRISPAHP